MFSPQTADRHSRIATSTGDVDGCDVMAVPDKRVRATKPESLTNHRLEGAARSGWHGLDPSLKEDFFPAAGAGQL